MEKWRRTSIGILLLGMSACSPLEPMTIEPEMSDLQLTVDTLKTSLRDAQRTVAELRGELDVRRQELADVQIARAQLEGRLRETERRLTEARHVIDLQRQELAGSRSEREQMGRTRASLENKLEQLQKQLSKQVKGNVTPAAMVSPRDGQLERGPIGLHQDTQLPDLVQCIPVVQELTMPMSGASSVGGALRGDHTVTETPSAHMLVKPGDTLWNIARRYRTSVSRLMVLNALSDDRIQVGQALWITEPAPEEPRCERM
jgi:Tfp pilus assembly protein FimV